MAETTNCTVTVTYDCPYRSICSDNGKKCETCANNPKRSYYRPVEPYIPYYPYNPYPWYPYYPYWTTTTSTSNNDTFYQPV